MAIAGQDINSLKNSIYGQDDSQSSTIGSVDNGLSSIQNPISGKLNKVLFKINSVSSAAESKIDKLIEHITISSDNRAKIELINNTIVITVKPQDKAILAIQQQRVQSDIDAITKTLNLLTQTVNTLNVINNTAKVIKTAMEVQEVLLSFNPATKAMFSVFKKAIKIVFLKDMMVQYINVIDVQLSSNKAVLNNLVNRFHNLRVQVRIEGEQNLGNTIDDKTAEVLITNDILGSSNSQLSQDYTADNGLIYLLKVEKYGERKLVGKAFEKFSGMLITQTAPSIIATTNDLYQELKDIINIQK